MTRSKVRDELLERPGRSPHLHPIGDHSECPEHVVRIFRTVLRDSSVENDRGGLIDFELRALDEVREVGLEKRQVSLLPRA